MNREQWLASIPSKREEPGPDYDLSEKVYQAIGEASMCWSETPKGIFESDKASKIAAELIDYIEDRRQKGGLPCK